MSFILLCHSEMDFLAIKIVTFIASNFIDFMQNTEPPQFFFLI